MELHRYDIIEAKLEYGSGSIQKKKRPYIIVSNEKGIKYASIITILPLTCKIKKENLPVHCCLEAKTETGLKAYSMILGEQLQTIDKKEVIRKIGSVRDASQRENVNKVCFNSLFFGEYDWEGMQKYD
jgi:mRNA interferase MazF